MHSAEIAMTPAVAPLKRDRRVLILLLLVAAIFVLGLVFSRLPGRGVEVPAVMPDSEAPHERMGFSELPSSGDALREQGMMQPVVVMVEAGEADAGAIRKLIKQADAQVKAKRFKEAIALLNAEQPRLKDMPEAYLLLGRALEGKKDYATARDFYRAAIDLNPYFADAYWGYATASEGMHDLESALGAMRIYLHTESNLDPRRLRVAQARSALWEWEAQLGRGAWGPTKGIPPGFTAEEIKRDGRGVAIKVPVDGTNKAELKSQDKIKLFKQD